MSPTRNNWQDKIKQRNSALRSPTEQAVFPMGTPNNESAKEHNSKTAEEQIFADTKQQNSKSANQQSFASTKEQTFATAEQQNDKTAKMQTSADAKEQNSKNAKVQNDERYADLRRITFHIPQELFRELKLIAAEDDMTMLEIGAQMAAEFVDRKRGRKK